MDFSTILRKVAEKMIRPKLSKEVIQKLETAKKHLKNGRVDRAIDLLNNVYHEHNETIALYELGRVYQVKLTMVNLFC